MGKGLPRVRLGTQGAWERASHCRWAGSPQLEPFLVAFTVAMGAEFTVSVILHVFPRRQGECTGGELS